MFWVGGDHQEGCWPEPRIVAVITSIPLRQQAENLRDLSWPPQKDGDPHSGAVAQESRTVSSIKPHPPKGKVHPTIHRNTLFPRSEVGKWRHDYVGAALFGIHNTQIILLFFLKCLVFYLNMQRVEEASYSKSSLVTSSYPLPNQHQTAPYPQVIP